jgi:hypothetical protein
VRFFLPELIGGKTGESLEAFSKVVGVEEGGEMLA